MRGSERGGLPRRRGGRARTRACACDQSRALRSEGALRPDQVVCAGRDHGASLVVHPGVPAKSVADLLSLARKQPGKLQYASAGVGSVTHLAAELFKFAGKVDILHVPFKGAAPAMLDVVAGHVNLFFRGLVATAPQVRAGRLRALGVGSLDRNPVLPDVPSIAEAGVPGYETVNWFGIVAPAGTAAAVVERLHKEISVVQRLLEIRKQFDADGATVMRMNPAQFGSYMVADLEKWGRVVKEAGIKAR